MSDTSALLQRRTKPVQIILDKLEKYLNIIKDIVRGLNIEEYNTITNNIITLHDVLKLVASYDTEKLTIRVINDLYQQLAVVDAALHKIIHFFGEDKYLKLAIYNMSSTYTTNMHREKDAALAAYEKYLDICVQDDDVIFDAVLDKVTLAEMIDFITSHTDIVNKFTMTVLGRVIQLSPPEKRRQFELLVERQKDIVLGSTRIATKDPFTPARYNLVPATQFMSEDDLFKLFGGKKGKWAELASAGPGVIVIHRVTASPIEFNLSGMINNEYILSHDLRTTLLTGLTKKVIDRFNTAKMLPRGDPKASSTEIFPGRDKSWRVVETINNTSYRVLSCDKSIDTSEDKIIGLVNGITTRPHQYNMLHSEIILETCFDKKSTMYLADYEKEKITLPSSEPIRRSLLEKMTDYFEPEAQKIKNLAQLKHASIDVDKIADILLEILTHSTGIHGKGTAEYLITYLVKFDNIIRVFIKELERQWSLTNVPSRTFDENTKAGLAKILTEIFKTTTAAAIDELDRSKLWTEYDISLKEFFLDRKQAIV